MTAADPRRAADANALPRPAEPTTIREALDVAAKFLTSAGIGSARLDSELLLGYVLRRDRAWLLAHDDEQLDAFRVADFESLVSRRSEHTPLVHLTGTREFFGLDFEITPDVLTPRVETEQIAAWAVETAPTGGRLIDIGTGSGALAVAIAVHRPDLTVTATEISPEALAVARRNARRHGANTRIDFIESDLWESIPAEAHFDTIVTNLPYLSDAARDELMPEVRREPAVALFGGPDGLDLYRRFLRAIPERLISGGHLYTECDPWQHKSLIAEAAKYGLAPHRQNYFILEFIKS